VLGVYALMSEVLTEPIPTAKPASHEEAHERQRRGTRQLFLARSFFFASAYAVAAILTRKLGTIDYGIYGVIISQLLWLEMIANAGVPGATAKLMANEDYDAGEVERSARAFLVGFSILLFGACWFLAAPAATLMRIPHGEILFRIAIVDLPFAAAYASYDGILYGRRQFGALALAQVIYSLSRIAGILTLVWLGFSIERVLVVSVISTFLVCVALFVCFPLHGFRARRLILREIVALAAPFGLYLVLGQVLLNMDLWLLKGLWLGDGKVIGQYVASANLARSLMIIPAVQAGVLFASVAWAVALRDKACARLHIQEATRFALIIAVPACVLIEINGYDILSVLFSSDYGGGDRFLSLQLVGFGFFALLDVFAHALMAAGQQWLLVTAVAATVPVVFVCNYLLIHILGAMGAAISMLLGMAVSAGVTGGMAYRHFGPLIRFPTLLRVLLAAAVVGLVSVAITVRGPAIIIKLTMLGGFYLVLLYLFGEITAKDLGFSKESTAKHLA
jgi:O-antigen/teichoic acid export membrane protein